MLVVQGLERRSVFVFDSSDASHGQVVQSGSRVYIRHIFNRAAYYGQYNANQSVDSACMDDYFKKLSSFNRLPVTYVSGLPHAAGKQFGRRLGSHSTV